jgi:hypothetical protein
MKLETRRQDHNRDVSNHQQVNPDSFNNYFLSVAVKITQNIKNSNNIVDSNSSNNTVMHYLLQSFRNPFPQIKFNSSSTKEIEKIINSLKTKTKNHMGVIRST